MDTRFKGEIARLAVMARALEKGWIPSTPVIEQARYDLILDDGMRRFRVQIKYTDSLNAGASHSYYVSLKRSNKGSKMVRTYNQSEIDAVIVYIAGCRQLCWIPPEVFDGRVTLALRTKAARNGQVKGCLFAEMFDW